MTEVNWREEFLEAEYQRRGLIKELNAHRTELYELRGLHNGCRNAQRGLQDEIDLRDDLLDDLAGHSQLQMEEPDFRLPEAICDRIRAIMDPECKTYLKPREAEGGEEPS